MVFENAEVIEYNNEDDTKGVISDYVFLTDGNIACAWEIIYHSFYESLVSSDSDVSVYMTFINTCSSDVDLFWWDFKGNPVSYGVIPNGDSFELTTYETHPWTILGEGCVFEFETGLEDVYYPHQNQSGGLIYIIDGSPDSQISSD